MGDLGGKIMDAGGVALAPVTGGASLAGADAVKGAGGGKKQAPAPPDFGALADKQTAANRPNQTGPFGSTTWDPTHQTQTTSFSDAMNPLVLNMQKDATGAWSKPLDSGADARQHAEDALYSRATARLDPMWQQKEQATNASLANQGLDPGSEAGGKALDVFGRSRNDAYSSALNDAITGGGAEASRQQQLDLNSRNAPLQGMQGLKSLLQMPGFGQAGDLLGAGKMGYDANLSNFNANGGPLGGWGQLLQALGPLIKAGGMAAATGGASAAAPSAGELWSGYNGFGGG